MKTPVTVVGIGMTPTDLTAQHMAQIQNADLLIGGRRHLAYFKDLAVQCKPITADMSALMADIKRWMQTQRIVVLASGDP